VNQGSQAASASRLRRLGGRVRKCWPEKVGVLLGLTVGICVPYFTLQRVAAFPLRRLPVTPVDRWVDFDPRWVAAYLSLALLVPIAPLLASSRDELVRYAKGLAILCLPCFAAFLLFPVAGPRPDGAAAHELYQRLISWDGPLNAFPSLHAGLAVFSLLFAYRVTWEAIPRADRMALGILGPLWGAAILYSTLATKQHWVVDLAPGALLACAGHALAWRRVGRVARPGALALFNP
jgi:membrane-associated phospholipid phosphatase